MPVVGPRMTLLIYHQPGTVSTRSVLEEQIANAISMAAEDRSMVLSVPSADACTTLPLLELRLRDSLLCSARWRVSVICAGGREPSDQARVCVEFRTWAPVASLFGRRERDEVPLPDNTVLLMNYEVYICRDTA
jgi:hypothetical protein